jgi:translation initiation factor IF-2
MRVYELAKKLGIENKELIPELKRLGITVTSHSSALDDEAVEKVVANIVPKVSQGRNVASVPGVGEVAKLPKPAGVKASAHPVEEPPKVDKKRILIKRKKTDEELAQEAADAAAAVFSSAESATLSTLDMPSAPGVAEPLALPDDGLGVATTTAPIFPASQAVMEGLSAGGAKTPPSPLHVGESPVAKSALGGIISTAAHKVGLGGEIPQADKKKIGPLGTSVVDAGSEKGKRAKKSTRDREAEPVRREDATRWEDLRTIPVHRREDRGRHAQPLAVTTETTKPRRKLIKLPAGVTVKEFAELVGQRPADVLRKLMDMGQLLTFNHPISSDAAQLIAESYGVKIEVSTEKQGEDLLEAVVESSREEHLQSRPPVVTIMGHVDHGKTSLLDAIRETRVTEQEAGGITQHIGAYTVSVHGKQVTFLDTPGHEAFTAMRARGAKITDLVILVVAADDGVMPQTIEAINHAKAANVPIIVAVNKMDKPGANSERVKNSLTEYGLIPESWGGETIFVEVSAKQKTGLDTLLEMILLQAEVLELQADPHRLAKAIVIEAKLDRGRGPVATVLVQSGILRVGDAFVVGSFSGRVRALVTDRGAKVQEAGASMPVEVFGLPGVPGAGDPFVVCPNERVAREVAESRMQKQRQSELTAGGARVSLDDLYARIKQGDIKELAVVIKADVQGSAEAVADSIAKLSADAVKLRVIHRGVGGITETDVLLASASGAIIIGFNVRPEPKAAALAEREGVDIRSYSIIYNAIEDIRAAMEGLLDPTLKERVLGRAEVRQVFSIPKAGTIAGCYVLDGMISRSNTQARVVRDNVTVYEGKLGSLRRFKDDAREVQQGYECGMSIENFGDLKPGDVIEVYTFDRIAAKL